MTINLALVTSEALVFGCDSISSAVDSFVSPWAYLKKDDQGEFAKDANGNYMAAFPLDALQSVVTNAFSGVTKMFRLSEGKVEVAATTAGLAKLCDQTIRSIANEYLHGTITGASVDEVAHAFLAFVRKKFESHCSDSNVPIEFVPEVEFLLGGYDQQGPFPSLYRLKVKENSCTLLYDKGESGIAWAGQSDGVERLVFGIDGMLKTKLQFTVNSVIDNFYDEMKSYVLNLVPALMTAGNLTELPAGINAEFPAKPVFVVNSDEHRLDMDFGNLPLQDAVDLVSYMVNLQSGRAKFVRGVPTVGGRTHIGILQKDSAFTMLNEPPLTHRNTGYGHDF